jgi:undecaprenyl-diphosphatase
LTDIQALILGIVQGATEFLPISSSGHLVLVPWILDWHGVGESNMAFDVLVHLGTLAAVFGYFRRDFKRMIGAAWSGIQARDPMGDPDSRLAWFILGGSIPAGLAGLALEDWFEGLFGNPAAVAVLLFGTAGLLCLAERVRAHGDASRARAHDRRLNTLDTLNRMKWADALWIGAAQAMAILPGISRSGATIAAGLVRGFDRASAARFSFLLGTPAIIGAAALQLLDLLQAGALESQIKVLLIGFASAAVVGYLAIHALLLYVRQRSLNIFAVYCALFGAVSLIIYVVRGN